MTMTCHGDGVVTELICPVVTVWSDICVQIIEFEVGGPPSCTVTFMTLRIYTSHTLKICSILWTPCRPAGWLPCTCSLHVRYKCRTASPLRSVPSTAGWKVDFEFLEFPPGSGTWVPVTMKPSNFPQQEIKSFHSCTMPSGRVQI